MMNFGKIQMGTLLVSLGVAAAVYVAVDYRLETKRAAADLASSRREKLIAGQRTEIARLRVEAERLHRAPAAAAPAPAPESVTAASVRQEAILTLAEMRKQGVIGPISPAPTRGRLAGGALAQERDGRLPPAFAQTFGLTPAEFDALQGAVLQIRQQLDGAILNSSTVRRESPHTLVIEVALGTRGAVYRDELRQTFLAALGPERFAAYDTLRTGGVENLMRSWGGRDSLVTITKAATPEGPHSLVRQDRAEDGRLGGSSSIGTSNFEEIRRQLGPLAPLLPADF